MPKTLLNPLIEDFGVTSAIPAREMRISVAHSQAQVTAAWRLVYRAYREAQLIDDNPFGIHTVPHAVDPSTSVVIGCEGEEIVSTLTIMHDGPSGLPLDRVYKDRLDEMRAENPRIMEVGLFADKRLPLTQATNAVVEMMRFVFYSSCWALADIVIGVNPSHAKFYERMFGFEKCGPVSVHPTVRNRPVVLLRVNAVRQLMLERVPRRLLDYAQRPIPRDIFNRRARLEPTTIAGTTIGAFVEFIKEVWNNLTGTSRVPATQMA